MCIAGRPQRQHCAPTLHFNTDTNLCDHPSNTDCPVKKTLLKFHFDIFFNNIPLLKQERPVTTPPPPVGFDCRAQAPLPVPIFPHPTNCSQFYICDTNGNAHLQNCHADLLFSPDIQDCDIPERVTCAPGATIMLDESAYDLSFASQHNINKEINE